VRIVEENKRREEREREGGGTRTGGMKKIQKKVE